MKKELNIAQRVEILLREGVENPKKWAKVHGYEEPTWGTNDSHGWAVEYRKLRDHHLAETAFLFEVIKELCEQVKSNEELPYEPPPYQKP